MKVEGQDVFFTLCAPIEATAISVQRIPGGSLDASLWEDAWLAGGTAQFQPSTSLTFGVSPEGMETVLGPNPLLEKNWDVKLVVDGLANDGREINIWGEWQTSAYEEGIWYANGGGHSEDDDPCT